jgi:carbonic anhydrase
LHYASFTLNVHTPSIHSYDEQNYDLELHIVHKLITGEEESRSYAIVSLLFKSTEEETPFFSNWNPSNKDTEQEIFLDKIFQDQNYKALYYKTESTTARKN